MRCFSFLFVRMRIAQNTDVQNQPFLFVQMWKIQLSKQNLFCACAKRMPKPNILCTCTKCRYSNPICLYACTKYRYPDLISLYECAKYKYQTPISLYKCAKCRYPNPICFYACAIYRYPNTICLDACTIYRYPTPICLYACAKYRYPTQSFCAQAQSTDIQTKYFVRLLKILISKPNILCAFAKSRRQNQLCLFSLVLAWSWPADKRRRGARAPGPGGLHRRLSVSLPQPAAGGRGAGHRRPAHLLPQLAPPERARLQLCPPGGLCRQTGSNEVKS